MKTIRFGQPRYIGDPINAVRLFNDLEVDELVILDISATRNDRPPNFQRIREIVSESFIPVAYGGGIKSLDDARALFKLGVEKVVVNSAALKRPALISELAGTFGSQSIVVAIDYARDWKGRLKIFGHGGKVKSEFEPVGWAEAVERDGAGEIFLNAIDRDGTSSGYDVPVIAAVSAAVRIPLIACGGAGTVEDLRRAVDAGASAAAAGSLFVLRGPHRAVLINYPSRDVLSAMMTRESSQ